ncbi:S1/P1 nuclease [Gillisia sp. Q332]|uniref:S1/P1 nuclease n=1 Tax=Gillisia xinjiangensis TaxID=3384765 RepID=UPI003918E8FF
MKNLLLLTVFFLGFNSSIASEYDWGQNGHRATGKIAQNHLSKKAKKEIDKLLQGKSLAFVSTYADEIKSDSKYREYGPWHYVNLPSGETKYSLATANPDGDLLAALKKCKAVLQDASASREEKEFYLKMLVHFVGDLHQPLHAGRGEDKGGNDIQVRWYNDGTNIHSVWDTKMIESYNMSYTELAENTRDLTKAEKQRIASGTFEDWMYESRELSKKVYASAEIGEKLGYRYMYDWFPVVQEQLQKGGIRLAQVLNEIYK